MAILLAQEQQLKSQFEASDCLTVATLELVKLQVSQINKCGYCIDMHTKDAFKQGETAERIIGLSAWQQMPCYSDIERCALQWAQALLADHEIPQELYLNTLEQLGEQGIVDLTFAVNAINSWNRVSKAFLPEVGSYKAA
jgi:AhpD family alkylhydroperoxidase